MKKRKTITKKHIKKQKGRANIIIKYKWKGGEKTGDQLQTEASEIIRRNPDFWGVLFETPMELVHFKRFIDIIIKEYINTSEDSILFSEFVPQINFLRHSPALNSEQAKVLRVLILIIGLLSAFIDKKINNARPSNRYKYDLIFKGGMAVEMAAFKYSYTNYGMDYYEKYLKLLGDYSTDDADLLVLVHEISSDNKTIYNEMRSRETAIEIGHMIRWLLEDVPQPISMRDNTEVSPGHVVKISILDYGDKYKALMDINFKFPEHSYFLYNLGSIESSIPDFFRETESSDYSILIKYISSRSLINERIYYLLKYSNPELARQNTKVLISIHRSLKVLLNLQLLYEPNNLNEPDDVRKIGYIMEMLQKYDTGNEKYRRPDGAATNESLLRFLLEPLEYDRHTLITHFEYPRHHQVPAFYPHPYPHLYPYPYYSMPSYVMDPTQQVLGTKPRRRNPRKNRKSTSTII